MAVVFTTKSPADLPKRINLHGVVRLSSLNSTLLIDSTFPVSKLVPRFIEVKPFAFNRSVEQNKRYWKLISELGDYLGYDEGEMHELCKYKFLSYKQDMLGDEMVVVPSSSKLTIKEFVEYLSKVERFARELGFQLKGDY